MGDIFRKFNAMEITVKYVLKYTVMCKVLGAW